MIRTPIAALSLIVMTVGPIVAHSSPANRRDGPTAAPDLPEPGISLALAEARRAAIESLGYDLALRLPAKKVTPITGRLTVTVTLRTNDGPLVFDFAAPPDHVQRVEANGQTVAPTIGHGHVLVPAASLRTGVNTIVFDFVAGDAPLNRGDDFLYTLFVPARAHRAFPCFDQPDLKARLTLALDLPVDWRAVANGVEVGREARGERTLVRFAETEPLSTYLMAFAAGRLDVEEAVRGQRRFRMFHRETDAPKLARNRDAIFDLHASALAWLEEYTGIPYPWGKFDFFLVPAFQFGGMEHPGAIFYNAPALLLDESATKNQLLGRASLIAHETAHMWFGDLVTMRWFDDVWTKEVYANFYAAKIVNPSFPDVNHDLRFLFSHHPTAYDIDRSDGTHPIRQPLENLDQAGSLYGAIIYQKAPVVMRQLERLVGEDRFRDGIRDYLRRFAFGNATWPELVALLDARVDEDLAAWSRAWVEEAGRPIVEGTVALHDEGSVASVTLAQRDPLGRGVIWPQALEVVVGLGDGLRTFDVRLDGPSVDIGGMAGLDAPRFVLPAGGGLGYARFDLDEGSLAYLLDHLPDVPDALTRGAAWVSVWDALLEGRVAPLRWFDLAEHAIGREADELNVQRMLTDARQVFWRFLTPPQRASRAPALEALLASGLDRATSASLKAAWFGALARVALRPETLARLERVWRKTETIEGLTLAEPDFISLALELAVREVPVWREILAGQLDRIENPDRKARFAFVTPALDADAAVRDAFFGRLRDRAERQREPWVLEALGYLHHPLRATHAVRYVEPSLDLLEEIRATGDIFFPKRWLDATLGGHQSAEVAATVRAYLERRPDLSPRLRRVVLQSSDELFRAARLLARVTAAEDAADTR